MSGRTRMRACEWVWPEEARCSAHEVRHGARGEGQTGPLQMEAPRRNAGTGGRFPIHRIESQAGRRVV